MRSAVVLLAIVALVVCPYDCAAKSVVLQASPTAAAPTCCGHCRTVQSAEILTSERSANEPVPAQPLPSEDGKSCLCEGAVFDAATRNAGDAAVEFSLLVTTTDRAIAPALEGQASVGNRRGVPLLHESGRLTRIALGSLLL